MGALKEQIEINMQVLEGAFHSHSCARSFGRRIPERRPYLHRYAGRQGTTISMPLAPRTSAILVGNPFLVNSFTGQ